jgi:hypothetical protein
LPVELETGCEVEPKVDAEGERGLAEGESGERGLDEADPPADELPPPDATPPDVLPLERPPPPGQEEEEEEENEEEEEERSRFGRGPAGTASESRDTSPRMCSANWAGTPDGGGG